MMDPVLVVALVTDSSPEQQTVRCLRSGVFGASRKMGDVAGLDMASTEEVWRMCRLEEGEDWR